jgi:muramidase (phage lysozyme)
MGWLGRTDRSGERFCSTALLIALPLLISSSYEPVADAARAEPPPAPVASVQPRTAATYDLTPQRRALLATIRFAEGTWAGGGSEGYRTLYGGGRFTSLEAHPDIVVVKRYASAAAGAYQFLPATWNAASRRLGLRGFGPANQDQVALYLADQRGALAAVDRGGLSDAAMARLAHEWASFPLPCGSSAYGQPVKSAEELRQFYAEALQRHRELVAGSSLS